MAGQVEAMVALQTPARSSFDYGNNLRSAGEDGRVTQRAFDYPGFVPAYIRPLFCEGKGPFRWAALSGDPDDIAVTDEAVLELFPDERDAAALDDSWRRADRVPGTAGADLLARATASAHRAGLRFNELVRTAR